jgi:hypothetical protein
MNEPSSTQARQLLESLYVKNGVASDADWSAVEDTQLVGVRGDAESGDSAFQSLMAHLVMDKAESPDQAKRLTAALAGIKAFMVHEILDELPTTSLEDLKSAADAAGYDIEVLV